MYNLYHLNLCNIFSIHTTNLNGSMLTAQAVAFPVEAKYRCYKSFSLSIVWENVPMMMSQRENSPQISGNCPSLVRGDPTKKKVSGTLVIERPQSSSGQLVQLLLESPG